MLKCPHCGGETAPGTLVGQQHTRFHPNNAPFFSLTGITVDIEATMCLDCGRIELRGEVAKLREILGR